MSKPTEPRGLLRFITAGSVDDGKSTLIGRLLLETGSLSHDHIDAANNDSHRRGLSQLDTSLFTDGLRDEREQSLTIDVAYRYFSTAHRKFIIADCPGHLQYTRNMVTGASSAELALILIDVRQGLVTQSKRHAYLCSLLRVPHILVVVNKMDLVNFQENAYQRVCDEVRQFAEHLEMPSLNFLPVSALHGDNLTQKSLRTPWYKGPSLLGYLESVVIDNPQKPHDFRFPIQTVLRAPNGYRGYAGRVLSGSIGVGEEVTLLPSGIETRLAAIDVYQASKVQAKAGDAVTLRFEDDIEAGRGDLVVQRHQQPWCGDHVEGQVCWLGTTPLNLDKNYLMLHGTRRLTVKVSSLLCRIDIDSLQPVESQTLKSHEIGRLGLRLGETLYFDAYRHHRETGCFLLTDPITHETVAAGMLSSSLQPNKQALQPAAVIWLTGLSGAGKSTLANLLSEQLKATGRHPFLLDGDQLRHGLCSDLGFSQQDRRENLRRVAHLAALAYQQDFVVICSLISPFATDRAFARSLFPSGRFLEIHVHCPLETCLQRDPKGLYAKALKGEISSFTGLDSPYEVPENPELTIDTSLSTPQESVRQLRTLLEKYGLA